MDRFPQRLPCRLRASSEHLASRLSTSLKLSCFIRVHLCSCLRSKLQPAARKPSVAIRQACNMSKPSPLRANSAITIALPRNTARAILVGYRQLSRRITLGGGPKRLAKGGKSSPSVVTMSNPFCLAYVQISPSAISGGNGKSNRWTDPGNKSASCFTNRGDRLVSNSNITTTRFADLETALHTRTPL
jgi:hypothetical protein